VTEPPGPTPEQFGDYLQRLRNEMGLSILEFASLSKIESKRIVMFEEGLASPTLDELDALAGTLGMPLSVLFRAWEMRN
jgi:transcriptional regulator with XRE-family HTH domain